MSRVAMAAALAAALVVGPAHTGASTGTVTTNTYRASSTSSDIDLSCKDLSLSVSGSTAKLKGTCNGGQGPSSVRLETGTASRVECAQAGTNAGRLVWGQNGFLDNTAGPHLDTGGTGTSYRLAGTCGIDIHNQTNDQVVDTLALDAKIENDKGELKFSP